jgi:toxin ParE1/3/4
MPAKLIWTPRAEEDLVEIYSFIALDDLGAADRVLLRLQSRIEMLAGNPRICPRRADIGPSVRMLVERPYVVLYETHPSTDQGPVRSVEIVRIVDGRRDLKHIL